MRKTGLEGIEGIYIVHAKQGYEKHAERLRELFGRFAMEYELVTDGDPSAFTEDLLNRYFTPGIQDKLRPGVLSCTLNHIFCYERMVRNQDRFALVFENDPYFMSHFPEKMANIMAEARQLEPGFMVSLENTTLEFPPFRQVKKGQLLYPADRGRCAGAYLLDLKAAQQILEDLKTHKCATVIDWWHNSLIERKVVRMYWAHPPLTEQGSHNGRMASTISSKNNSLFRRLAWESQKAYKTYITRWFK